MFTGSGGRKPSKKSSRRIVKAERTLKRAFDCQDTGADHDLPAGDGIKQRLALSTVRSIFCSVPNPIFSDTRVCVN